MANFVRPFEKLGCRMCPVSLPRLMTLNVCFLFGTRLKTLNFCNLYWLMIIDLPFFVVEPFVYFRMFVFNRGFGVWKLGGQ